MISDTDSKDWLSPSAALNRFSSAQTAAPDTIQPDYMRMRYGFRIGGLGLLIGPNTVSEVIEKVPVYRIPNTSYWLLGLLNLRGNLVPIFDLKSILELEDDFQEKNRMIMILDEGDKSVGILIDGLPQTQDISHGLSRFPPLPTALREHVSTPYVKDGVAWMEFDHHGFFKSLATRIAN